MKPDLYKLIRVVDGEDKELLHVSAIGAFDALIELLRQLNNQD